MAELAGRLVFDEAAGEVRDGPRRYVLMRADVLMGAIARLAPEARAQALDALAASVRDNGADSVRAYLAQSGGDPSALLATMPAAAADLGWGAWRWEARADDAGGDPADPLPPLAVRNSPFAAGWAADAARRGAAAGVGPAAPNAPDAPVCAPIAGMLAAVAQALGGPGGLAREILETRCAAVHGGDECRFEARAARRSGDARRAERAEGGAS